MTQFYAPDLFYFAMQYFSTLHLMQPVLVNCRISIAILLDTVVT